MAGNLPNHRMKPPIFRITASGMPCPDPVCASGPGPVADVTVRLVIAAECGLLRAGVRSVLRAEADFRVVAEVPDALHAVTVARDLLPDVLLLDIDASREALLPALDALADLTTLRILLLASRIAPGEEVEVLARGARGVFFKSSDPPLLVKSIRAILAGDYWVGRDVIGALVHRPLRRARATAYTSPRASGRSPPRSWKAARTGTSRGASR